MRVGKKGYNTMRVGKKGYRFDLPSFAGAAVTTAARRKVGS